MEQYRINDLERLTGIKAHTIRIWEKRYNLIEPSRTSTNRRYYNGAQLLKLMNVSTLVSNGYKISTLADLSDIELKATIENISSAHVTDITVADNINELTYAMLCFDEVEFERVFQSVVTRMGLYKGMLRVFYPWMRHTGVLWRVDKLLPAEEHFAISIIRKKLIGANDRLPPPKEGKEKFLLFLPENEWHELGLLFADYILRSAGVKTVYLGQSVPVSDLKRVCGHIRPDHLLTFFVTPRPPKEIEACIKSILKYSGSNSLFVAGNEELLGNVQFSKEAQWLKEPAQLASFF